MALLTLWDPTKAQTACLIRNPRSKCQRNPPSEALVNSVSPFSELCWLFRRCKKKAVFYLRRQLKPESEKTEKQSKEAALEAGRALFATSLPFSHSQPSLRTVPTSPNNPVKSDEMTHGGVYIAATRCHQSVHVVAETGRHWLQTVYRPALHTREAYPDVQQGPPTLPACLRRCLPAAFSLFACLGSCLSGISSLSCMPGRLLLTVLPLRAQEAIIDV